MSLKLYHAGDEPDVSLEMAQEITDFITHVATGLAWALNTRKPLIFHGDLMVNGSPISVEIRVEKH